MKFLVLMLSALALTSGDSKIEANDATRKIEMFDDSPTDAMSANMNAYVDLIMIQVGPFILRNGWIPMDLPDFTESIEHRVLLITYHGELHLTQGVLHRLVSVARHGNAIMTYDRNMLRIQMAASIRQIAFRYDYTANIMGLTPSGWLEGSTDQFAMACDFIVDFSDFMIYMQDFRVVTIGSININMRGNPLIDWLSNLIITTVTHLFRGPITDFISARFAELVQGVIDDMNNRGFAASHTPEEIKKALQDVLSLKGLFQKPLM